MISYPWPDPPSPGGILDVAPGIRWLRMPLPFKLDHINLWLLEDGAGWTVVDTGIGLEDSRALWREVIERGLEGRPVTRVIVTHFHPDHMGNAHWLTERFGTSLWCTQAEWMIAQLAVRGGREAEHRVAFYRRHGLSGETLEALRRRGDHYAEVVPSVTPDFHGLYDHDVLDIGGQAWQVLTVFGHSPEQAVLYARGLGVLVSGDQILPKITTNVSVWSDQPRGNPLRLYLDSLSRFDAMPPDTLVLPSHGLPFRGLPVRLERLRQHHDERLARTLDAVAKPRTAAEVVPLLFERALDMHQLGFAFGETLAHLHYLEWRRRVVRLEDGAGVYRFKRA